MSETVQETLVSEVEDVSLEARTKQALKLRVDSAYTAYLKMSRLKGQYEAAKVHYDSQKVVLDDIADDKVGMGKKTTLQGGVSTLNVGKRANKAEVDQKELLKVLGLVDYLALAKVGVTDARKYCLGPELKRVLTEENSGTRKFTWYEK